MRRIQTVGMKAMMVVGLSLVMAVTDTWAQSGNLEPPSSAVDSGGNPVPTTQTQPSWDQTLPVNERFMLVMDGDGVLDGETGLVWQQSPKLFLNSWGSARSQCMGAVEGKRRGWRLPSMHELASLVEFRPLDSDPVLPAGHPFSNVQPGVYWTTTTDATNSTNAWVVNMVNGLLDSTGKATNNFFSWCVRGGGPLADY